MVSFELPSSDMTCFGKCCKGLLYAFNVLFLFSGIAACAVGIWAIVDTTSIRIVILLNSRLYVIAAFVLIGASSAAVFVSFIGCCAARYENRCLLVMYSVFLLVIFVAEFTSGVIALSLYTQATAFANEEMWDSIINKYGQGNQVEATDAWNYIQRNFDCCGFAWEDHEGAELYQISLWFDNSMLKVPPSCCKRDANHEPINLLSCQDRLINEMTFVNTVGCSPVVVDQAVGITTILSGAGIGISLLQLIGMVLAFCVFRQI